MTTTNALRPESPFRRMARGARLVLLLLIASCTPAASPSRPAGPERRPARARVTPAAHLPGFAGEMQRLLEDPAVDPVLARAALWYLHRVGAPTAVLIPALRHRPVVRALAVVALGERADAQARAALLAHLEQTNDPGTEPHLAWALARTGPAAVPALIAALAAARPETRAQAARALGRLAAPAARIPLERRLADRDPRVRAQAAWALGELRAPVGLRARIALERDERVQAALATALGKLEDEAAWPILRKALTGWSGAPGIAAEAALLAILRRMPRARAVPMLVDLSQMRDVHTANEELFRQGSAAFPLARKEIWKKALASCEVPNQGLGLYLLRHAGARAAEALIAWRGLPDRMKKCGVVVGYDKPIWFAISSWAEANLKHPAAPKLLAQAWCIALPPHWWRRSIVRAFLEYGLPLVPTLLAILRIDDTYPEYPAAAAHALAELHVPAAIPEIFRAARRGDGQYVLGALARFPEAAALRALRSFLSDRRPGHVAAAVRALAERGDRVSLPRLRPLLRHPHLDVARAAIEALGRLGTPADRARLRPLLARRDTSDAATLSLLALRDPATLKRLPSLLSEPYSEQSVTHSKGFDRLVPVLSRELGALLGDARPTLSKRALALLVLNADKLPGKELARLVGIAPDPMKPALAWALADRRDPTSRAALLRLTAERRPRLVAAGAYGLALQDARAELPALVDRLQAPEPARRRAITVALCRWPTAGRTAALPALRRLLTTPPHRAAAETILGCWGHPLGVPALRRQLRHSVPAERRQAIRLLADLKPPDLAEELVPALEDADTEIRRLARVQLLRLGSSAIPALRKANQTGSARLRTEALRLAWWLGATLPEPLLRGLAMRGTPATRAMAIALLGRLRSPAARPLAFLAETQASDASERRATVATLANLPDERVWPAVKAALLDPAEPVRIAAWKQLDFLPLTLDLGEQQAALKKSLTIFDKPPWPSLGLLGDRRLVSALWTHFHQSLKPEDKRPDWHHTLHLAAADLAALADLGARRAFTGPRLQVLHGVISTNQWHEKSVLKPALAALREISGRPLTEEEQLDPPSP